MKQGFRHIRGFLAIARLGSFTQAAQALHISQPALTVQIRQLEAELGVRLLDRDRRKVTLTDAGRSMLDPLRRIINELDGTLQAAHDLAGLIHGRLTVAVLPSLAAGWLPPLIQRFHSQHPGIDIRVMDVPADQMISMVRDDLADLGLGPWSSRDRAVRFHALFEDRMHVFFPLDHPLARVRQPSLQQLTQYPHVLTAQGSSVRQSLHQALEEAGLDIEVACEVSYVSTAISMVKAGLGISILPLSTLAAAPCDGLQHTLVGHPRLKRQLGLISSRRVKPSPPAQAFIDSLLAHQGEHHPAYGLDPSAHPTA